MNTATALARDIEPSAGAEDRRILIVDDDRDFADSLGTILTLEGYTAAIAYSAREAQAALRNFDAHIAILDYQLGATTGVELLKPLRQCCPDMICILATAYADTDSAIAALRQDMYDYLCKPLQVDELLATLEQGFEKLRFKKEKRTLQERLGANERQFRNLIAGSIQGILIHRDGKPLFANQAMADIFGYDGPQEILALPSVQALKAEHERTRLEAYSAARMTSGSAPVRYEFEGVRKDGNPIWLENFVTVVEWRGERAVQTTSINITDRKHAEEALARSLDDLAIARDQANEANRTKSEFLATMSHELRTPLNAIIGFSEIIKDEALGPVERDRYLNYVRDIHASGEHLLALINDILDLSKVESGAEEVLEDDLEVPYLIDSVVRLLGQRASNCGVELRLHLQDRMPLLNADERKMKQILVNLLTNAIKFTEPGGSVTIKAWCRADSGFVFQVIDTGIGIAPDDVPKALSQFGQVDCLRNRTHEGTGLGLPLSRSLAELHSGSLDLQSKAGVGTTVTVRLPAFRIAG